MQRWCRWWGSERGWRVDNPKAFPFLSPTGLCIFTCSSENIRIFSHSCIRGAVLKPPAAEARACLVVAQSTYPAQSGTPKTIFTPLSWQPRGTLRQVQRSSAKAHTFFTPLQFNLNLFRTLFRHLFFKCTCPRCTLNVCNLYRTQKFGNSGPVRILSSSLCCGSFEVKQRSRSTILD